MPTSLDKIRAIFKDNTYLLDEPEVKALISLVIKECSKQEQSLIDNDAFQAFVAKFDELTGYKRRVQYKSTKALRQYLELKRLGYKASDFIKAIHEANNNAHLTEGGYLTPEYITRLDKFQLWHQIATKKEQQC